MYTQESLLSKNDLLMFASELLHQAPERIATSYRVLNLPEGEELDLRENRVGFLISCVANDYEQVEFIIDGLNITVGCCWLPMINLFFNKAKVSKDTQLIYYVFEVL